MFDIVTVKQKLEHWLTVQFIVLLIIESEKNDISFYLKFHNYM